MGGGRSFCLAPIIPKVEEARGIVEKLNGGTVKVGE